MTIQNLYGLGDYNTEQIKEMASVVKEEGLDPSEIFARRPDAADDPESILTQMPARDAAYIIPDAFAGETGLIVAKGLTLPQLEAIGREGDINLKTAVRMRMQEIAARSANDVSVQEKWSYIMYSPAWQ